MRVFNPPVWHAHLYNTLHAWCTKDLKVAKDVTVSQFVSLRYQNKEKVTKKKPINVNCRVRVFFKNIFAFAELEHNGTYGLRYSLTVQKSSDNEVSRHEYGGTEATNDEKAGRLVTSNIV